MDRQAAATDMDAANSGLATEPSLRAMVPTFLWLFVVTVVVRFLGMPRVVNVYDEGIVLTGAMRVMAGQIPHRDFYANYGPAQFYSFALLFKVFGASVLMERLLGLLMDGATVVLVCAVVSRYCRRAVAVGAGILMLIWLYGLNMSGGPAVQPVGLLNLASSVLLLAVLSGRGSTLRMAMAGALAGLSALYRYDTGVALLGIHVLVLGVAALTGDSSERNRYRMLFSLLWPYLAGFLAMTVPAASYYAAHAPVHDFVHDIIVYPSRSYRLYRSLPFPGVRFDALSALGFYLPIVTLAVALGALVVSRTRDGMGWLGSLRGRREDAGWRRLLFVLGLLSFVMFFKGIVRAGLPSEYLSLLPCVVMVAVLYEKRTRLATPLRVASQWLAGLTILLAILACADMTVASLPQHSVPGRILRVLFFRHRAQPEIQAKWCDAPNPVTKGFCFLPDDGHVNAIEFIASHTKPSDTLFVGTARHDKIFANDNLTYFATQRLPATKWSHFDPGLQNTVGIQQEMIGELERNAPPYIVLDSEYGASHEPNESAKSTGVMLLDDYIHEHYRQVKTFDEMTVWQRE